MEIVAKTYKYKEKEYIKILANREMQIRPVGQKYLEGFKYGISMPKWLFDEIKKIELVEETIDEQKALEKKIEEIVEKIVEKKLRELEQEEKKG